MCQLFVSHFNVLHRFALWGAAFLGLEEVVVAPESAEGPRVFADCRTTHF